MFLWEMNRKRRLAPSAGGERRTLKRMRKRSLLRGGADNSTEAFTEMLKAFKEDIVYLFASHWRYPYLAPYINWFCTTIDPEFKSEAMAQNTDPTTLANKFRELFNKDPSNLEILKDAFNDFFSVLTYDLQSARYNDVNWVKNLITLRFIHGDGRERLLMPGKPEEIPVDWKVMLDTILIAIDGGEHYSVVRVGSIARIFQTDGSFALNLTGNTGHTHIITGKAFGRGEELRHFQDLKAVLRVSWNGPTDVFRTKYYNSVENNQLKILPGYSEVLHIFKQHIRLPKPLAEVEPSGNNASVRAPQFSHQHAP